MPAEELVFDEKDDGERYRPIAQKGYKVVDYGLQTLLAGNGKHSNDNGDEQRPDETRYGMEIIAKQLKRKTAGVVDRDIVPKHRKGKQDQAELGPSNWVVDFEDEATQGVVVIRVRIWGVV